jgi:mono/diheme cytochrome c family protein
VRLRIVLLGAAFAPLLVGSSQAEDEVKDPFLGQPEAIAAGHDIYGSKCYICHHSAGGRGPNLFATKLTDAQFLKVVTNGRQGTQMPAFGKRLTQDEIWQLHAFIKSTDHY